MRIRTARATGGIDQVAMCGERGNPLDLDLVRELVETFTRLDADPACRVVVLTSDDRHFCAGATGKVGPVPPGGGSAGWSTEDLYALVPRLFAITKPVVAVVTGAAIGGGLGLALAADFRVAETGAVFAANFTQLGYHPGFALTLTLPHLVGAQHAADLLYTGRRVEAGEAARIGLCDEVCGAGEGWDAGLRRAARLAAAAPLAVRRTKSTLRAGIRAGLAPALSRELAEQAELKRTADFREGMAAARERRAPDFRGL